MTWMNCINCDLPMIGIVSYENFTHRTTCWSCQKEDDPSLEDGDFVHEEYEQPTYLQDYQDNTRIIDPEFDRV